MAHINRSVKSGNEWNDNELEANNIKITFQDALGFFVETPLPSPTVSQEVLNGLTADDAVNDTVYNLLTQLDLAMMPSELDSEESAIDDFAVALFHFIQFLVCGEHKYAKYDLCIIDRNSNDIILIVQEDYKRFGGDINPHAQLIAGAIAAFQNNNARRRSVGLETWNNKVIPGIIMIGTSPSFFKIPVTQDLVRCVEQGQYPPTHTIVTGHVPDIPRPNRPFSEGMKPLDNRRAILQCYEAFEKFIL